MIRIARILVVIRDRISLRAISLLALGVLTAPVGVDAAPRPNVVLIIIDTLRADRMGAYGYPAPASPELDELARSGVRFDRVISQSTWTRPSIASMLTSLHPRTLGLRVEEGHALNPRHLTLAEALKASGYWTAGATANPNTNRVFHFDQGFDHYVDSEVLFPQMPGAREQKQAGKKLKVARSRETLLKLLDISREKSLENGGRIEQPGFLQVVLMDVHEYQKIPEPLDERYDALEKAESGRDDLLYSKALSYTSAEVALFMRVLLRLPGWEHTLIVVTSDHGEALMGDHPSLSHPKWHGYLVYETQALVPWIMYSSKGDLPAGRVVERPVRLLDLMPTVLDYAGVPIPVGIAGTSLMPLLRETPGEVAIPDRFVVETRFRGSDKTAVYSNDWIYIENRDQHPGTRPHELQSAGRPADGGTTDRAAGQEALLTGMQIFLDEWRDRFPAAEPTLIGSKLSDETRQQLRALGYVD